MKANKYPLYFVLCTFVLSLASCEPRALTQEEVLLNEDKVAELTADGRLYTINEFLDEFMTEHGNFKSDSSLYRTRSAYKDLDLFSIDTLPTNGPGIYLCGRITTDDYGGNFYKSLVMQQIVDGDQQNIRISVDMGSAGGLFQQGQMILIRCNGLAVGRYANEPQLCTPSNNNNIFASSAEQKVGWAPGRISAGKFRDASYLIGKPDKSQLVYDEMTLAELQSKYLSKYADVVGARKVDGRLVRITGVHFTGEYDELNKGPMPCNRYNPDADETAGNPELDKNACTFGPTTGNVGYPQSRYVADQNDNNRVLVSTSEYARYAYFYLPDSKYVGSVTGILGYYMDNGKYDPDGGEWSVTPCLLSDILPECQKEEADPRWIPTEWSLGTAQPEE